MTTPRFSLATEAWIPVLTPDGYTDVNLTAALTDRSIIDIASGDVLADAAIRRLLLACRVAAAHAGSLAAQWAVNHADDFDILHPTRPFAQNPRLDAVPVDERPLITTQLYDFTAGTGSTGDYGVVEPWAPDTTLDLPTAARLLLVRQMFSAGGLGARLGKYTGAPKVTSFQQSLHFNTIFAWVEQATLAESLATMVDLVDVDEADLGTFHFTLTEGKTPGEEITEFGLLDVLTYPSRSLHLTTTDTPEGIRASHLTVFEGMRLPRADEKKAPDALARQRRVFRHTTWWTADPKKAPTPRGVRTADFVREDWRHLMECYATVDSPSIISPEQQLPSGADVLLTTAAGDKSRIDNTVNWRLPAPRIGREKVTELIAPSGTKPKEDHSLYSSYRRSSYGLSATVADRSGISSQDGTERADKRHTAQFDRATRPIILDALTGADDLPRTRERLAAAHVAKKATFAVDIAGIRPLAAAQINAQKLPDWATTDKES